MADDGSGVYSKLAGSVAVTATTIASNPYNQQIDDIANSLNNRLNTSGVKPMTGNLQMGGNKITGQGAGTAATDSATIGQVQSGIVSHATATAGTVDAITVTHAPVMTAWTAGARGRFTATGANVSTTPTLNPDGIGGKTFVRFDGRALVPGDIAGAGHEVEWEYNGTNVVILNPRVMNGYKGAAVASAATTNIWAGDGDFLHITGTTTITSFGTAPQAGAEREIVFDGILTLTHNATSLILPGAANITTAAGDRCRVRADTTANMYVTHYTKASGQAVVVPAAGGNTILGTQATTSGTTQSLTGLTLTNYKFLWITCNSVTSASGGMTFNSISIGGAAATASRGIILVDLTNGTFTSQAGFATGGSSTNTVGPSGLTTASTSVTLGSSAGAFTAGSFTVYGLA